MERSFGLTRLGKSLFLMAAIVLVGCGTSTAASPNPTAQPLPSSTRGNHEELLRQGADALKLGRTKLAIEDYCSRSCTTGSSKTGSDRIRPGHRVPESSTLARISRHAQRRNSRQRSSRLPRLFSSGLLLSTSRSMAGSTRFLSASRQAETRRPWSSGRSRCGAHWRRKTERSDRSS